MNRTRRTVLAALVIALAGAGGIYAFRSACAPVAVGGEVEVEGQRVRWPVGTELRYRLSWRTSSGVHILPSSSAGRLDSGGQSALEGTLVLKVVRAQGHKATLLATFADLETVRFVVNGNDGGQVVPEDVARAGLVGPSAVLEVDDRGHLEQLRAPKDKSGMFADVMHALGTELAFELAQDDSIAWKTEERTMSGVAQSSYRFDVTDRGTLIERKRDGYSRVHALRSLDGRTPVALGKTNLLLGKDGVLTSFESSESVRVEDRKVPLFESSTALTLTLSSRTPFVFAGEDEIAAFEVHLPGKDADPRAGDRVLAAKSSRADLLSLLSTYAASGTFERGQLARAAAYLRLHPEDCPALEGAFTKSKTSRGRSIVFDVLSSAGSAEAQGAMRRLLDLPEARKDASLHRMLVQRFALISSPTPDSVRYLRELEVKANAANDGALARAALVSRGSAIGRRASAGDREAEAEARALLSRARADLSASSVDDRATLIKAIGNMRHPDATAVLALHSKDESAGVRASVAVALRNAKDPGASKLLLEMMADTDPFVARSAIDTHLGRRLTSDELGVLATHVRSSETNAGADAALATAIVQHAHTDGGAVKAILQTLLARAPQDSEEAARLRAMLEGLAT